jgi:hypothetical protein
MAHEDAGKYAAKHEGAILDEEIASRIKEKIKDNKISCAAAHKIAGDLGIKPSDVGINIDLLEVRINKCQLGLFGYGDAKKITGKPEKINPDIEKAIEAGLVNNRLSCAAAWEIADRFGIPKITVADICEAMKIKITSCQLGAFN